MALSFEYRLLKWGYGPANGPACWAEWYPVAVQGRRQSPVALQSSRAVVETGLGELSTEYPPVPRPRLENTGVRGKCVVSEL